MPLATLPGMAERTVTISSGGKTFSFTGWKVGWVNGPAPLVDAVRTAKQFLTYVSPAPFQLAIAAGPRFPPEVIGRLATELGARRDQLCDGLDALGYEVYRPAATYFATTDIAPVAPDGAPSSSARHSPLGAASWPYRARSSTTPRTPTPAGRSCGGLSASGRASWTTR